MSIGMAGRTLFWTMAVVACSEPSRVDTTKTAKPLTSADNDTRTVASREGRDRVSVEVDDHPQFSLSANRFLVHLGRSGLVVPMVTEGLRKYSQDYEQPWGRVVFVDGEPGRVLSRRQTSLTIPWFESSAARVLSLRVHGLANNQRLGISINGTSVVNADLQAGWQTLNQPVADGLIVPGENVISFFVRNPGTVSGLRSYALFQSLELTATPSGESPVPVPTSWVASISQPDKAKTALHGFSQFRFLVEVPQAAWLEVSTGAPDAAVFVITATQVATQHRKELLRVAASKTWTDHQLDLSEFAGQLTLFELLTESASPTKAAWGEPRIVLSAAPPPKKTPVAKNVILLVIDALRSDHMPLYASVYGTGAVRMPNVVARAKLGSAVFLHNQAASPSSPPSHGSIQTGMIPRVHGVDGDKGKIKPGTPTLSTQLNKAGIATGYFGNNPFGMERLQIPGEWTAFHQPGKEGKSNDCTTLVDMIIEFAGSKNAAGKRFFVSSLPYETHTPYRYHAGITENYYTGTFDKPVGKSVDGNLLGALNSATVTLSKQQWQQLRGLYDGEAEYMDGCFGRLLAGLKANGTLEDTVFVWTSDHGEGMFEHGKMGHAFGHYRELGDVPLVIFWPSVFTGVVNVPVVTSHLDIVPTITQMMGVAPAPQVQGASLWPMLERQGPWFDRVVSLEYGRSYSLRSRRWKLIAGYNGEQEYFDLQNDPWEAKDIRVDQPLVVRYLRDMAGFFLAHRSQWKSASWGDLNNHGPGLVRDLASTAAEPR